jgi:GR25 family glycosyltransferase involved in LPS biosynthesis
MLPVFVISLTDSSDRRLEFYENNYWLSFQFFDAINSKKRKIPFINLIASSFSRNDFSLGALGALLSHRKLWKKLLHVKENAFIIFEDDVILNKKGYEYWTNYILNNDINNEFDIVFLGSHDGKSIPLLSGIKSISLTKGILSEAFDETLYCAYGYIITKKGARKLLKKTNLTLPVDYWGVFNKHKDLVYYCIYPNIAVPSDLAKASTIQSSKTLNKSYIKYFYTLIRMNLKRFLYG